MLLSSLRSSSFFFFLLCSAFSSFGQIKTTAAQKDTLPSPTLWLRADMGKIIPSFWADRSGNKMHASAQPSEDPLKKGMINFNPSLSFDGINDYMRIPYNTETLSALTLVAVFKSSDTTERGVWAAEKSLAKPLWLSTRRVAGPDSVVDLYGRHENRALISTIVQQWIKTKDISSEAYFAIGSMGKERGGKPFKGELAELLIFEEALPFLERQQYETYLAIKYGITLRKGNYVSSSKRVLWEGEKNKAYHHRITAIGRDDRFALYQKQSQSVEDSTGFLLLTAGVLAPSNSENKSLLGNENFILIGDNNLSLSSKSTSKPSADTTLSPLERKWLASVSGATAKSIPLTLAFDISQLEKDSLGYWLLIDRSGEGNFSLDKVAYFTPDSLSKDKKTAYFRKLHFDKDNSGKDSFTLARAKPMLVPLTSLTHPSCNNPASGEFISRVMGGKAPFTYELSSRQLGLYRKWQDGPSVVQGGLEAGDYKLKVTDGEGRMMERVFTLKAPLSLRVELGEDTKLLPGKTMELNAATYIPDSLKASYHWESSYGFQSKEAKITAKESGIYRVKVSTPEGCEYSDEIVISGSIAQRFELYPSIIRAGDPFRVSVSLQTAAPLSMRVYDMKGKMYEEKIGQKSAEHYFRSTLLTPGMYMIFIETAKGIEAKKLIVN